MEFVSALKIVKWHESEKTICPEFDIYILMSNKYIYGAIQRNALNQREKIIDIPLVREQCNDINIAHTIWGMGDANASDDANFNFFRI